MPKENIPYGTTVSMGGQKLVFGQTIFQAQEANDILTDPEALHARLDEDGYLLIRNFYDRGPILEARREILAYLATSGYLAPDSGLDDGIVGLENKTLVLPHKVVRQLKAYLEVVSSGRIMAFFERLLGGPALTLDHKWPRAVGRGVSTGAHYDIVYMGAGTKDLYTVWTPLGDLSLEMGPLAVCPGSNKLERLKQTYGTADAHNDLLDGWLSRDPLELIKDLGVTWASTPFWAGDVVVFGMFFLHGSLDNVSDRYRLSSDNRYQLADEPVDERHMGPNPDQIPKAENRKSIAEMRAKWGI